VCDFDAIQRVAMPGKRTANQISGAPWNVSDIPNTLSKHLKAMRRMIVDEALEWAILNTLP